MTGTWTKRDADSGKFMDQKEDGKPFKGVRKEKSRGLLASGAWNIPAD